MSKIDIDFTCTYSDPASGAMIVVSFLAEKENFETCKK